MDTTWPFNFDCVGAPQNLPSYYDKLIIPSIFYDAVIKRNKVDIINIIKYNPVLSIGIVIFYDNILRGAFYMKKAAKFGMPYKIRWATNTENNKIIMNFNEQSELYNYITTAPWKFTNMGFLINTINNYLVQLRYVMGLINNKIPANDYYYLATPGITNNLQMKYFIARFIPGYIRQ